MADHVTTADSTGNEFEVEVGADGKHPVSVNNPPAKALAGYSNDDVTQDNAAPSAEETKGLAEKLDAAAEDQGVPHEADPEAAQDEKAAKKSAAKKSAAKSKA